MKRLRAGRRRDSSRSRHRASNGTTFWNFLVRLMASWIDSLNAVKNQGTEKLEVFRRSIRGAIKTVARNSNRRAVDQFFAVAKERTNEAMRSSANAIDHALQNPATAAQEAAEAIRTTATETRAKAGDMKETALRGVEQVQRFSSGVKEALAFYVEDAQAMYEHAQRLYARITDTPLPEDPSAKDVNSPLVNMPSKPGSESSETEAHSMDMANNPPPCDADSESATTY